MSKRGNMTTYAYILSGCIVVPEKKKKKKAFYVAFVTPVLGLATVCLCRKHTLLGKMKAMAISQ